MDLRDIESMKELYNVAGAKSDWFGDYLGFTYNGVHSTQLGITRVASSNRYEDQLLPTLQDKTASVPGNDGMYYFGSNYTSRQFSIDFAFDGLTDAQLRQMRNLFGDKKLHPLIFDEMPYKVYQAKVTSTASIKHLCFDAPQGKRIYKGDGNIQFTCFFPYATSRYKYVEQYTKANIPEWDNDDQLVNISEWIEASGIQPQGLHDRLYGDIMEEYGVDIASADEAFDFGTGVLTPDLVQDTGISIDATELDDVGSATYLALDDWYESSDGATPLTDALGSAMVLPEGLLAQRLPAGGGTMIATYNPGDVPTDWQLIITLPSNRNVPSGTIICGEETLALNGFTATSGDNKIIIDSRTNLIEGLNSDERKTGTIYNAAINAGSFFKIPLGTAQFVITGLGVSQTTTSDDVELKYNYLYF